MKIFVENEQKILLYPSLAIEFGIRSAIILYLLHDELQNEGQVINGKLWIHKPHDTLQKQVPFVSLSTITRLLQQLEKRKIIQSGYFNKNKWNRTKWYTINYKNLITLVPTFQLSE